MGDSIKLTRDEFHQMNGCMPERKYQSLGRRYITLAEEYFDVKDGKKDRLDIAFCLSCSVSREYTSVTSIEKLKDLTEKFVD